MQPELDTATASQSARRLTARQAREVRLSMKPTAEWAERLRVDRSTIINVRAGRMYGDLKRDEKLMQDRRLAQTDYASPPTTDTLLMVDSPYRGGLDFEERQEAMDAAHECAHGRLPHDNTPPCGCWPQEARVERLERFRDQAGRVPAEPLPAKRVAA